MSIINSSETKLTMKSKSIAAVFDQYRDTVLQYNEEPAFDTRIETDNDIVTIEVSVADRDSYCPRSLQDVIYNLIALCSGDEAIASALEEGENADDLEEEFGDIVPFASALYERSQEQIDSIESIRWETVSENYDDNKKTTEMFTYDRTSGEKYSHKESKLRSRRAAIDYSLLYGQLTCDFCDRICGEEEIVRKRTPDGSICTVCETCCQEYDLSDWETVGNE